MTKGRSVPPRREESKSGQATIETHPAIPGMALTTAENVMRSGRSVPTIITLVDKTAALAQQLVDQLAQDEYVDCKAGCAWCCSTTYIAVSAAEAIRIAEHLRANRTPMQISELCLRLARREQQIKELRPEQRERARIPCALLVENRCSVYNARPLMCRGLTSSSAAACAASYHAQWQRPIPNGQRHLGITVGVRQGVRAALDRAGVESASLDLTAALRIALLTPDAAQRWMAGEPIFSEAHLPE